MHRVQVDIKDIDGDFSKRYRYRLGVEREFNVQGTVIVPYAQGELFYDTRYETWNRQLYQAGVEIELTSRRPKWVGCGPCGVITICASL